MWPHVVDWVRRRLRHALVGRRRRFALRRGRCGFGFLRDGGVIEGWRPDRRFRRTLDLRLARRRLLRTLELRLGRSLFRRTRDFELRRRRVWRSEPFENGAPARNQIRRGVAHWTEIFAAKRGAVKHPFPAA